MIWKRGVKVFVFSEQEIRSAVGLDLGAVSVVEEGFSAIADGLAKTPPIMALDIPEHNGEVDVKTAYIQGVKKVAVKISSGFFDNPKKGLPSGSGMMVLVSALTGIPEAVFLDNGYLTDVRTAAAGAVAAKHLAPTKPSTVGIVGSGIQARLQVEALRLVRGFERVLVFSRTQAKARDFADDVTRKLGVPAEVVASAEEVVRASDVVVTATPSRSPIILHQWLHGGMHITAMGSDAEMKQELDAAVVRRADRFVCDLRSQSEVLGELHHPLSDGTLSEDFPVTELGDVVTGRSPGRTKAEDITICDLTGTGVQDTVIAVYAYELLQKQGLGTEF